MALFYQHDRFWFVPPAIENKLTLSALLSRHRSRISNKDSITHTSFHPLSRKNILKNNLSWKKNLFFFFLFLHMSVRGPTKIGPKVGDGCVGGSLEWQRFKHTQTLDSWWGGRWKKKDFLNIYQDLCPLFLSLLFDSFLFAGRINVRYNNGNRRNQCQMETQQKQRGGEHITVGTIFFCVCVKML